jgi:hypothetical protein
MIMSSAAPTFTGTLTFERDGKYHNWSCKDVVEKSYTGSCPLYPPPPSQGEAYGKPIYPVRAEYTVTYDHDTLGRERPRNVIRV